MKKSIFKEELYCCIAGGDDDGIILRKPKTGK